MYLICNQRAVLWKTSYSTESCSHQEKIYGVGDTRVVFLFFFKSVVGLITLTLCFANFEASSY